MKDNDKEYRAYQIRIEKGNVLFDYCDKMCFKSKNLYNIANFYIRQAFSGLKKDITERHENETTVIETVNKQIKQLNEIAVKTAQKKKSKDSEKKPKEFKEVTREQSYISYGLLDGVFKLTKQPDYLSLPAQTNQHTLKLLNQDWQSFFASIKDYKVNPSKYKGMPKPPRYAKKDGRKPAIFTNQICKIRKQKYLIFPKTKLTLELGKIGLITDKLSEVRIIPSANFYVVELVFQMSQSNLSKESIPKRIVGIDLGVDNFATMVNNIGLSPIIVKGGVIKSVNQYYNKQRAYYYSILRMGKKPKEGQHTSKRLQRLDANRNARVKDFMHKASYNLVKWCEDNNIDTIIIGKNDGFKDNVQMRRNDKQNFIYLPYSMFISMMTYKANAKGINVIITEESYTSKASFLDNDDMPIYAQGDSTQYQFSGRRIERGMYKSQDGTLINADCNGAYNIIRKVVPNAFSNLTDRRVRGVIVTTPTVLSVA